MEKEHQSLIAVNVGGSSIKARLYASGAACEVSLRCLGLRRQQVTVRRGEAHRSFQESTPTPESAAALVFELLRPTPDALALVAHRVKFGRWRSRVQLIDDSLLSFHREQSYLNPLHSSLFFACYEQAANCFPSVKQLAVYDNAIFRPFSEHWTRLPLPPAIVRRYELDGDGQHGLACEYIIDLLGEMLGGPVPGKKLVICHVGSGVSVSAFEGARPVSNSMAFASCDGPVMNTRSGTLPTGAILRLINNGFPLSDLARLLNEESGLYSLAGVSPTADTTVAEIFEQSEHSAAAAHYLERLAEEIAKALTRLGGVDALVFSGGIGTGSPQLLRGVLERTPCLDVHLSDEYPAVGTNRTFVRVSQRGLPVFLVHVDELDYIRNKAVEWVDEGSSLKKIAEGRCLCPGVGVGYMRDYRPGAVFQPAEVVLAERITPQLALDARHAAALVVKVGAPTFHGAAMSRELGVPTMAGVDLARLKNVGGHARVIVDCTGGEIYIES